MRQTRFKQPQRSDPTTRRIVVRKDKNATAHRRDIRRAGMDGDDFAVVADERPAGRRTRWYLLG